MHLGRPKPIGKIAILRCALQPLCTKWTLNVSTIDTSHPDAGKSAQDHTTLLENTTPLMNTNNSAKYLLLFVFTHHLPRFLFAHRLDTPACTSTPGLFHLTCLSLVHDLSLWNDLLTTHVSFSNRNQHNRSLEIIYFGISIPGPSKGCPGWRSLSGGLGLPAGTPWKVLVTATNSLVCLLLAPFVLGQDRAFSDCGIGWHHANVGYDARRRLRVATCAISNATCITWPPTTRNKKLRTGRPWHREPNRSRSDANRTGRPWPYY